MKPSLIFMMRLSGSVKFFWALGRARRRGERLSDPVSCGLRLVASPRLSLRFDLGFGGRFRLGLQFGLRRPDLLGAPLLVGDPLRHLLAGLVAAVQLVLLGVRRLGGAQPPADLGLQLRRALLHALVAHRLVLGGVRLDLRPVERDMAELHEPGLLAQLQYLHEQPRKRLQVPLAEVRDRCGNPADQARRCS